MAQVVSIPLAITFTASKCQVAKFTHSDSDSDLVALHDGRAGGGSFTDRWGLPQGRRAYGAADEGVF